MNGQTVKCRICGAPYKWFDMTVADQSACPRCVGEAERQMREGVDTSERQRRRRNFWSWYAR